MHVLKSLVPANSVRCSNKTATEITVAMSGRRRGPSASVDQEDDREPAERPAPVGIAKLIVDHPRLNEPLIEGILRRGETMNIIAPPKVGKSWLAYLLTLAIAMGRLWLDRYQCRQGRVLYIDNELHANTLAHRIPTSAMALELREADYAENIDVLSLRGRLVNLHGIKRLLEPIEPGQYDLIILDAFYRCLPDGVSENANEGMAMLYNLEDQDLRPPQLWVGEHPSYVEGLAGG